MRIENTFYNPLPPQPVQRASFTPAESQGNVPYYGQGVIVDISQAAKDWAGKNSVVGQAAPSNGSSSAELEEIMGMEGCQTCKSRRYVDGSSDSSVSYQSPTHISPEQSAGKVMSHEREHISNDKARAEQEDRRVISQTVSLSTSICPECGKMYVSGGSARTLTAAKNNNDSAAAQPQENNTTGETDV